MKIYKWLFILLVCSQMLTSCDNHETPENQYIGEWIIQDLSGEGSITDKTTGFTLEVSVTFKPSDHKILINDDKTLFTEGEVNGIIEFFHNDEFVMSVPTDILQESTLGTWSLDVNNQLVINESEVVEFDGNKLTRNFDINQEPKMIAQMDENNIESDLMIEILYERQ